VRLGGALAALVASVAVLLGAGAAAASGGGWVDGDPRSETPVFVRDRGRLAAFDAPGAGSVEFPRMNERGQIAGSYAKRDGGLGGYLRDAHARVRLFDVSGATKTTPLDVNDRGEVVGNACGPCDGAYRGFRRDAGGRLATFRVPGSVSTQAFSIDDRGRIAGDYQDANGAIHGYIWQHGRAKTVDVGGAAGTTITALNERGQTVGIYLDTSGAYHGFFRSAHGRVTAIDAAGVVLTLPLGLNNRSQIVGLTTTAPSLDPDDNEIHGFGLANGPGGPFTGIDIPGASDTAATGIDDRGRIVGVYENPNAAISGQRARAGAPMDAPAARRAPRASTTAVAQSAAPQRPLRPLLTRIVHEARGGCVRASWGAEAKGHRVALRARHQQAAGDAHLGPLAQDGQVLAGACG
jgi:hypothetical protein